MRRWSAALLVALVTASNPALAADERRWDLQLSSGVEQGPDYEGSRDHATRGRIWADGELRTADLGTFALDSGSLSIPPALRWDLPGSRDFGAGPLVGYREGRSDSNPRKFGGGNGSTSLAGLPEVAGSVDVGLGGHVVWLGVPAFAQVRSALSGLQGTLVIAGLYLPYDPSPEVEFTLLPTLTWANTRQMRAMFGVSAASAASTGLPAYNPAGGWQAATAEAAIDWKVDGPWHVVASVAIERLIGQAARSPLTESATQTSVIVGVSYAL